MYTQTESLRVDTKRELTVSPFLLDLLKRSSSRHDHLCPRQVLGVRMSLAGMKAIGVEAPMTKKLALVIVETDGCFADGIEVASGATIGHRTLRVKDHGKIAAVFANIQTGKTLRLAPQVDIRERAHLFSPNVKNRYHAQLKGYQVMPEEELFTFEEIILDPPIEAIISRPGLRTKCQHCGEEIINARQVVQGNQVLCTSCSGDGYYHKK